jgi:hypothetical protein
VPGRRARTADGAGARPALPDPETVDRLYGLEPVYEPAASVASDAGTEYVTVDCPYCGEPFETTVDLSAGSATYVEDCQVCCQPIEMRLEVDGDGRLERLRAGRAD